MKEAELKRFIALTNATLIQPLLKLLGRTTRLASRLPAAFRQAPRQPR